MEKSIFEKIANGVISGYIVWEDEEFMAFLDINPLTKGHTLVIPKTNIGDYIFEIEEAQYLRLMTASRKVARLLKSKLGCERVVMMVEGFEVPHVHVKLIPSQGIGTPSNKPLQLSEQELKAIQKQITSY
ncbi:MAG: HIT family protein [bacterium]|nr:HIT family protein [bacterium]